MSRQKVYEVRHNYPYEGHSTYGMYLSKRKAIKRAEALFLERKPNYDWIDVIEFCIGDNEPCGESAVWTSES